MASPTNGLLYEEITVSTSSVPLTTPTGKHCMIRVRTSPIRWRADGTDPTSSVGFYADVGTVIEFMDGEASYEGVMRKIEFIRDASAGADAVLEVHYFD